MFKYRATYPPLVRKDAPEAAGAAQNLRMPVATGDLLPLPEDIPDSEAARAKRARARAKVGTQFVNGDLSPRACQLLMEVTGQIVPAELPPHKQWRAWGRLALATFIEQAAAEYFRRR